jgi:magnesium-transporting ATPase (P-type)
MQNKDRSFAQQTRTRMVLWFIAILFIVGIGLIWIIYGINAAFLGFICLLGSAIPIGLIALFLFGLGKIADNDKH